MLARITTAKSGIVEYLEKGVKNGRDFNRDELDHRVTLDGNINLTGDLIKSLQESSDSDNYYHITLSFSERDLSNEKIKAVYEDYKNKIMSAYDKNEYNIYAEIHQPKIKTYTDQKTGEEIERLPHVHIVIPKKNLISDKDLNPFGLYTNMVKEHDSIQESINNKFSLLSPYDAPREFRLSKSDLISRYKGDDFSSNKDFKKEILSRINNEDIKSLDKFKEILSEYGDVSIANKGNDNEYYKVKLPDNKKNIRLKEPCFNKSFILNRDLKRIKPTEKEVNKTLEHWVNIKSLENKYIHPASKKIREQYFSLDKDNRKEFLNEREQQFREKHERYFSEGGRANDSKSSIKRSEKPKFRNVAEVDHGMPSMLLGDVDETRRKESDASESLLSDSKIIRMVNEPERSIGDSGALRWSDVRGGVDDQETTDQISNIDFLASLNKKPTRTFTDDFKNYSVNDINSVSGFYDIETVTANDAVFNLPANNGSYSSQILNDHYSDVSHAKTNKVYLSANKIDGDDLLNALKQSYGLNKEHYSSFVLRGEKKINIKGGDTYDHADFLKSHFGLTRSETVKVNKLAREIARSRKSEQFEANRILSAANRIETGKRLNSFQETMFVYRLLVNREKFDMSKNNQEQVNKFFDDSPTSLKNILDNIERQKQLSEKLAVKYSDLVPKSHLDKKNNVSKIEFHNKDGKKLFSDIGREIIIPKKNSDYETTAMALELAAEKFGKVNISGSKEFKKDIIDIAVSKDLKIVFANKKMQAEFLKQKELYNKEQQGQQQQGQQQQGQQQQGQQQQGQQQQGQQQQGQQQQGQQQQGQQQQGQQQVSLNQHLPPKLLEHGSAPFEFDKNNSASYFAKFDNGSVEWGVGIKEAIVNAKAQKGDHVKLSRDGQEPVKVPVNKTDNDGNKYTDYIDTNRTNWKAEVIQPQKQENNQQKDIEKQNISQNNNSLGVTKKHSDQATTYNFTYKYQPESGRLAINVNDKPISESKIPDATLEKIVKKDRFLKSFNMNEIKHGSVDLRRTNEHPAPKTYDSSAKVVKQASKSVTASR